jgi:hypothetical protein
MKLILWSYFCKEFNVYSKFVIFFSILGKFIGQVIAILQKINKKEHFFKIRKKVSIY